MGDGGEIDQPSANLLQAVFRQWAVQAGHLLLQEGFIHQLLLTFSFTSPRDDSAPPSGFEASQAQTGGKG
jgi:hypothetical protein